MYYLKRDKNVYISVKRLFLQTVIHVQTFNSTCTQFLKQTPSILQCSTCHHDQP